MFLNPNLSAAEKINQLLLAIGGLILTYILFWTPWTYARHYLTARGGHKSVFDLRAELYEHILRMSSSFFERNRSGSIVSRLISDIQLAQNLVGSALTNVWMDGISIVVILIFLLIDVASTLVALITFPFYILIFKKHEQPHPHHHPPGTEKIADMSGNLQEKIAGSVVVHAFTQEEKEGQAFHQEFAACSPSFTLKQSYFQSSNITLNGLLVSVAPMLVTLYCGYQVILGNLTVGEMVAVSLYLGPLDWPCAALLRAQRGLFQLHGGARPHFCHHRRSARHSR